MKKLLLIALSLCLSAPVPVNAQTMRKEKIKEGKHVVKEKPMAPTYTRSVSPGSNYLYVEEDWTWSPGSNTWTWNGNRWIAPTVVNKTWVPGHWVNTGDGWTWIEGYWK